MGEVGHAFNASTWEAGPGEAILFYIMSSRPAKVIERNLALKKANIYAMDSLDWKIIYLDRMGSVRFLYTTQKEVQLKNMNYFLKHL